MKRIFMLAASSTRSSTATPVASIQTGVIVVPHSSGGKTTAESAQVACPK